MSLVWTLMNSLQVCKRTNIGDRWTHFWPEQVDKSSDDMFHDVDAFSFDEHIRIDSMERKCSSPIEKTQSISEAM